MNGTIMASEMSVNDDNTGAITIKGEILPRDDLQFARLAKTKKQIFLNLDSPGGDVDAAMGIGRLLRKHDGFVTVTGKCYSACVLVFAGGVTRFASSNLFAAGGELTGVGIHRLYFATLAGALTQDQVKLQYHAELSRIRSYLRDMDVAPEFLSLMQSIEPEDVRLLTQDELVRYGLGGDVVYSERAIADQAAPLGITSAEYRLRQQRSSDAATGKSQECENVAAIPTEHDRASAGRAHITIEQQMKVDCALAIKYGISIDFYQQRSAVVTDRCKMFTETRQNNYCEEHYMATGQVRPWDR
jgi:hypothetical protein